MAKRNRNKKPASINLWVFTNDKENPFPLQFLQMLYQGAYDNTLGFMHALNSETNKIDSLIVGLDKNNNAYPLMRLLSPEEAMNYLAPDGEGAFYNDRVDDESSEAGGRGVGSPAVDSESDETVRAGG